MKNKLIEYIKTGINEDKLSHAFLVETNNCEACMQEIYSAFVDAKVVSNNSIENNLSVLVIRPENNLIDKNKILSLQKFIMLKSQNQKYKLYFILNANLMNIIAANKLLKTLEEPQENVIGFLLTSSENEMLDTIKSRCIHFFAEETTEETEKLEIIERIINVNFNNYLEMHSLKKELLSKEKQEIIKILELTEEEIINNIKMSNLAKKYKIIDNIIDLIKANVNLELCLDKMFIEMGQI